MEGRSEHDLSQRKMNITHGGVHSMHMRVIYYYKILTVNITTVGLAGLHDTSEKTYPLVKFSWTTIELNDRSPTKSTWDLF